MFSFHYVRNILVVFKRGVSKYDGGIGSISLIQMEVQRTS